MKNRILVAFLAAIAPLFVFAQGGTSSPYSQYGLGVMSDRSQGLSRGMNGASLGVRKGNIINTQNPASYSAVDSLTMLIDAGVSGQITNYKENNTKVSQKSANFEYFVGSFRMLRHVGLSVGVLPYSAIGYSYETKSATNTYISNDGDGGFREAFLGIGWQMFSGLSVGANVGYLWGGFDRSVISAESTSLASLSRIYSTEVSSYLADFGIQWQQPLSRTDNITVGATFGLGHKLGADATCVVTNVTMMLSDSMTVSNAYSVPMSYGVGVAYNHDDRLLVDADFLLRRWGSLDYPAISDNGDYAMQGGLLKDSYHFRAGLDYVPNDRTSRKYYDHIHYRLGAGYSTSYFYVNGKEGPKELSVSIGLGLPLLNNRSMVNISGQWCRTSATGMISENTFRINLGLTFNERWFAKWKID